jgi:hypothetical protein
MVDGECLIFGPCVQWIKRARKTDRLRTTGSVADAPSNASGDGTNSIVDGCSEAFEPDAGIWSKTMKKIAFGVAAALLSTSAAFAQSETPKTSQTTPAVSTSGEQNPGAPVAGKNSFTEAQAKSRIEEAGYTEVSGLKLDDQGIWRAMGTKDGKHGNVALDFQGNITMAQ